MKNRPFKTHEEHVNEIMLLGKSKIEVNTDDRTIFAEVFYKDWYILCENMQLNGDSHELTVFCGECKIEDPYFTAPLINWLHAYGTGVIKSLCTPFTHQDKLHANQIIYR